MKKIWKNNLYKEIFLIILSFILGALFVFVVYNRTNNYVEAFHHKINNIIEYI